MIRTFVLCMNYLNAACVLLTATCACAHAAEPAAADAGGCPTGLDDDGNGYADACEQLLWSSGEARDDGSVGWPTYMQPLVKSNWDADARGDIAMYTTNAGMQERTQGPKTAYFNSARVPADDAFGTMNDVRDYDAVRHVQAKRASDWIFDDSNATGVRLQPQAINVNVLSSKTCGVWPCFVLLPGVDLPVALVGKRVLYFRRTITGYGYDSATQMMGLRGGWQFYGY
jgi:hypothetical protein